MDILLAQHIAELQERNTEAVITLLDDSTAIIDHNVGNYTLEYIDASGTELKRQHIPFHHVKILAALVQLHNTLNTK